MKFKSFFFLLFLVVTQRFAAANPTEPAINVETVVAEETNCQLPPPSVLTVDLIGPGWAKVSWPSVAGAAQYMLQVFDGASNLPVGAPVFMPATANSAQVSTNGCQGSAYVSIWTVCPNNQLSERPTNSDKFDTVILDLVGVGFTPNNGFPSCNMSTISGCSIGWNNTEVPFRATFRRSDIVRYDRDFSINVETINLKDHLRIRAGVNGNLNQNLYFLVQNYVNTSGTLQIYYRENVADDDIAHMTYLVAVTCQHSGTDPTTGTILLDSSQDGNCTVSQMFPQFAGQPDDRVEETSQYANRLNATVSPNPFRDALTVHLHETKDPNGTTMHLYDLLGANKLTYQAPNNQTDCSFNTSLLAPGVYFLKIESEGKMETIKVVKTQ